jgi:histidinol-phosphate phosphatase family protein
MELSDIDKSWTLFIDRDGVVNHEKKEDYILNWNEFRFYDGTIEAMKILASIFPTIVMVTNQRGVGKELMTLADLEDIHTNMKAAISEGAGRIDTIYYCTSLDNNCYERKPNPGMAHLAQKDFPHIDFSKSIIIGNKLSDMMFGRNAGMYTIYVDTTNPEVPSPHPAIDFRFANLSEAANAMRAALRES